MGEGKLLEALSGLGTYGPLVVGAVYLLLKFGKFFGKEIIKPVRDTFLKRFNQFCDRLEEGVAKSGEQNALLMEVVRWQNGMLDQIRQSMTRLEATARPRRRRPLGGTPDEPTGPSS